MIYSRVVRIMAGWNLSSGDISDGVVFEEELWRAFNNFFSNNCRKQTTYKYGFLKSILDNLFSVEPTSRGLELSFQQLFDKFTENYWNLILKYNLKQAKVTSRVKYSGIERIIREAVHQYRLPEFAEYSSLDASLRKEIAQQVMFVCQENVVGAVYVDFAGKMYGFSKKEGRIWLNIPFYAFCKSLS